MSSKPAAGKRTLRETRALLGELDEARFLVKNIDKDEELFVQADRLEDIKSAIYNLQLSRSRISDKAPGVFATEPSKHVEEVFVDSEEEKNVAKKLLVMPNPLNAKPPGFGPAGSSALTIVVSTLVEKPESKSRFLKRFPYNGAKWDELQLQLFSLGGGGTTETTGKGEIALFCTYYDVNKSTSGKAYDLTIGERVASVKYFAASPSNGPRTASGSGKTSEKSRFLKKIGEKIRDFRDDFEVANLSPEGVAALYEKIFKNSNGVFGEEEDAAKEAIAKLVSSLLYETLTEDGKTLLIGCSDTGFKVLKREEICFVNISDNRYRIAVSPNASIGSTTYESRWVPESLANKNAKTELTKSGAKTELTKIFANASTIQQVLKIIDGEVAKLLNRANFATAGGYNVAAWDKMAREKLVPPSAINAESIVTALTTDIEKPNKTGAKATASESVLRDSRLLLRELFS